MTVHGTAATTAIRFTHPTHNNHLFSTTLMSGAIPSLKPESHQLVLLFLKFDVVAKYDK